MDPSSIAEIRSFNRFYTKIIGLLDNHILNSSYSLPEVRVMYEVNHTPGITASEIIEALGFDKGYLSRIIKKLEKNSVITKEHSPNDRRSYHLYLSNSGQNEYQALDAASSSQIAEIFGSYSKKEIDLMVFKMNDIKRILENQ